MAKYKLLEKSFIHNRLYEEGETVELSNEAVPGPHMQPLDAAAKKRVKECGTQVGVYPNIIEEMTPSGIDVTKLGASPQVGQSGMTILGQEPPEREGE
jgi:hypothetical protein